jgi:hypothetical protein
LDGVRDHRRERRLRSRRTRIAPSKQELRLLQFEVRRDFLCEFSVALGCAQLAGGRQADLHVVRRCPGRWAVERVGIAG